MPALVAEWGSLFLRIAVLYGLWLFIEVKTNSRGRYDVERQNNELFPPPTDAQVKWDLRHMREDMYSLISVNRLLLWAVVAFIVFKW